VTKWPLAVLVLLSALAASCSRSREAAPSGAARSQQRQAAAEPSGQVRPSREITLQPQRPSAAEPAATAATGQEQRVLPLPGPAVLPEDFRIGPLEDPLSADAGKRGILTVAEAFLRGLESGKVASETLLPERRAELERSLSYYLEQKLIPQGHRLGVLSIHRPADGQATAWMNLRLLGSPGTSAGELYLSEQQGRWYVSDIQIGFETLAEAAEGPKQKFVPPAYGWRLQ
jgi:hypothetical protein